MNKYLLLLLFVPLSVSANDLHAKNIVKIHVSIRTIYDGMIEVSTAENKKCTCNCSKDYSSDNYFDTFESYSIDFDTCFWRSLLKKSEYEYRDVLLGDNVAFECQPVPNLVKINFICTDNDTLFTKLPGFKSKKFILREKGKQGGWIIMLNDTQAEKLMNKLLELFTNQVKSMIDYVEEVKDCHGCE